MSRVRLFDDGDRSWMDRAACAGHPHPDWWYPESSNIYTRETKEAARVCSECPVRAECYEYGRGERFGIYAGVLMSSGTVLTPLNGSMPQPRPARPAAARPKPKPRPKPVVAVEEPVVAVEPEPMVIIVTEPEPAVIVEREPEPVAVGGGGVLAPVLGTLRKLSRFRLRG